MGYVCRRMFMRSAVPLEQRRLRLVKESEQEIFSVEPCRFLVCVQVQRYKLQNRVKGREKVDEFIA